MNDELISCEGNRADIPYSVAKLLVLTFHGKIPKRKRIFKKKLKQAFSKALVLGLIDSGVDISEKLKKKYMK